ncbi:enoyl-CoA hydratase [Asticcacaulis machinosus]|uniref:Enoyl-CoA hydratase n=1 Tax=Asticcacaulis machinosus TaxID=2984211 RepID=A0ABT5HE80_9CAUL|nr:enoyl-CoA hydratase [Asticcacaulis machinosus]MDC7674563.1 enoyl-CoA hydratase [Asticcacaulis machinosus]
MSEWILSENTDGIVHVRLNRASKKNALTSDMYRALSEHIHAAAADIQVKAVVLSAEGSDFCAGNDILDFMQSGFMNGGVEDLPVFQFLKAINYFPKPLVAAVQGQAVGVGTTLLLHCDLVYLSSDARLSLPFVQLGLVPEAGSSRLLPKLVGHQRAFAWMTLGEVVTAPEALRLNLATAVVDDDVLGAAMVAARRLAKLSPSALRHTKSLMRDPDDLWAVIVEEGRIFREQLASPEAAQAFTAFMKKSA